MADGKLVSQDFLNRASRSIRKTERDPALRDVSRKVYWPDAGGIVEGTLTSAVTAASPNGKSGATTFTINLWSIDGTDTHDPQYLAASTDDTTGVNTTNRTAISGSHAFCAYMNGRLQFLFGDCP